MDPLLQELEQRIKELKKTEPWTRAVPVEEVLRTYQTFADLYCTNTSSERQEGFLEAMKALANKERFSAEHASRALYDITAILFIGIAAHGCKVLESYSPITHVSCIIASIPQRIASLDAEARDDFLSRLHDECRHLMPSNAQPDPDNPQGPDKPRPGLDNPMALLSRIYRLVKH